MHVVKLSLLVLSLIVGGQCRGLWSVDLPQVSALPLEKGKPLKLPQNYESVQIAELKGTLYSDSLSQLEGVKELRITRHGLTAIEKGALCSAPDMKILELDFYDSTTSLTHLTKEMFENCTQLEELILRFNSEKYIYTVDKEALEDLINLKSFALQGYKLNHLSKDFFKLNPSSLISLTLSSAELREVDYNALEDFNNLETLIIRHNRNWTHLPKTLFKDVPKLKELSLRDNSLKDLTWDEFEGLSNVKHLDLASNEISSFDAERVVRNLPRLVELYIEMNPLACKLKERFVDDLKQRYKHPIKVVYKFDPGYYDSCKHDD